MKLEDFSKLIEYVDNWNNLEVDKPKNEPLFVIEFVKLLKNYPDYREISFDGEGSYFGKQITLCPFSIYGRSPKQLSFEVAYSKDKISIYKANHNGYWTPEFISMTNDDIDFQDLKNIFFNFLMETFGLNS